jgi:predicted DsbA family dithiol-disulfide isomerase
VQPVSIVVHSDLGCPWAHVAVHRLLAARDRLGLSADDVVLDHRPFALEIVNERPTPWRVLTAEVPVAGGLEPGAGWQVWQGDLATWPVSTLLALEAVQVAKEQGLAASERLDRALRVAFFGQSRCISMRHVVLAVASECGVDRAALQEALDSGRGRSAVVNGGDQPGVKGSPHVFLPDGTDVHNPGVTIEWEGDHGVGFPVVTKDDPAVYDELLGRAAEAAGAGS